MFLFQFEPSLLRFFSLAYDRKENIKYFSVRKVDKFNKMMSEWRDNEAESNSKNNNWRHKKWGLGILLTRQGKKTSIT